MTNKNKGFTLIELVVVIAVLGILAVVAVPRFINITSESRIAVLNGLAGNIRTAVSLVQTKYKAAAMSGVATPVTMDDGTTVIIVAGGIPSNVAGGIDAAINFNAASSGLALTSAAGSATFAFNSTCQLVYNAGAITLTTGGC